MVGLGAGCRRATSRRVALLFVALVTAMAGLTVGGTAYAEGAAPTPRTVGWALGRNGGGTGQVAGAVSVETTDVHGGRYALRFTRTEPFTKSHYLFARQFPTVRPKTAYTLSVWVKSEGTSSAKAPTITVTGFGKGQRLTIPTGAYGWRHLTGTFTTGADQTRLRIYLIVEAPTDGLLFDDLSLAAPDGHELLANGGFEQEVDSVRLTDDSLLLPVADPVVHLRSSSATVEWTAIDSAQVAVASGQIPTAADGSGSIDLTGLGVGFYTLSFSTPATASSQIPSAPVAILADAAPVHDSRLGVGAHSSDVTDSLAPEAAQMGFSAFRTDARWDKIEKTAGNYSFPAGLQHTVQAFADNGMKVLPITDYANPLYDNDKTPSSPEGLAAFGRFAAAVDAHFHTGMLEAYNEPNHGFNTSACGRSGSCVAQLQQAVYQAVKAESPDTTVAGPAISGPNSPDDMTFLRNFFEAGGLRSVDAVSIHPYAVAGPPEVLDDWIPQVQRAMRAAGQVKPIWITEDGWSVFPDSAGVDENVQADYLIRSEALAFANGVSRYYWYELNSAGHNPNDRESNFGLIRSTTATSTNSPRPAALAQAVFARQIDGKPFTDRLDAPEHVYGLRFGSGDTATNMLWSVDGVTSTVSVRSRSAVTVTDREGHSNRLTPIHGRVVLQLTGSPVFVSGQVSDLRRATPLFTVEPTQSAFGTGVDPTVTVTVHRSARSLPGPLTLHLPGGDYQVPTRGRHAFRTTVTLPARATKGNVPLTGVITDAAGHRVGLVETGLTITSPITTGWQPTRHGGVEITITNNTTKTVNITGVDWQIGDRSGTAAGSEAHAGSTARIKLPVQLPAYHDTPITARVSFADGSTETIDTTGGYNPLWRRSDHNPISIEIPGGTSNEEPAPPQGSVTLSYDHDGIHIDATVVDADDEANQVQAGRMWHDDSLQLALASGLPGTDHRRSELLIGRIDGHPTVYLTRRDAVFGNGQGAVVRDVQAAIARSGDTTTYHVVVPWHLVYASDDPGQVLSMSWLINDNDDGKRGWAAWGGGIATDKNNADLNAVTLR